MRLGSTSASVRRLVWETANGKLSAHVRVKPCPQEPTCVRLDHLAAGGVTQPSGPRPRSPKGSGSKQEIRDGVWKLTVHAGRYSDGSQRRVHRTVRATSATD